MTRFANKAKTLRFKQRLWFWIAITSHEENSTKTIKRIHIRRFDIEHHGSQTT